MLETNFNCLYSKNNNFFNFLIVVMNNIQFILLTHLKINQ